MKQYLLAVHGSEEGYASIAPEVMEAMYKDVDALNQELKLSGAWVFGGGLMPAPTATVVRPKDNGDVVTTDGPYLETKEHLGGFWIIKAEDLDAALEIAGKAAIACRGAVEVRPFQDEPEA